MSDYAVIRAVSKTLFHLLTQEITKSPDPGLTTIPIDLRSPKQMDEDNGALGISVYLYRVIRDGDLLNRPPVRVGPNQYRREGVPVQLHYLVTPIQKLREDEHLLLGKVVQVLNDYAILRGADLQDGLHNSGEELRVSMEALSVDDLAHIWYSLLSPYRLSLSYVVQVVNIDSNGEILRTQPVLTRESAYAEILSRS